MTAPSHDWPPRTTQAAALHVKRERMRQERLASWHDVAAAFDAGLRLALANPQRAARDVAELDDTNNSWANS